MLLLNLSCHMTANSSIPRVERNCTGGTLFFGSGYFLSKVSTSQVAFRNVLLIWSQENWYWQMIIMINYRRPVNALLRWSANKFPSKDKYLRKWNISGTCQSLSTTLNRQPRPSNLYLLHWYIHNLSFGLLNIQLASEILWTWNGFIFNKQSRQTSQIHISDSINNVHISTLQI